MVPVYTLSAADHSATAGGFNPYLFAAATSTLFVETLSHIIDENASTVSIAMFAPPGPTAPSGLTVSTIGTSTAMVVWTDNSNDELSFLFDVRRPLLGESFPGMHTVLSNNATTSSLSSLTPNQSYEVRVAAANGHATSSYATYTFTTLAVPPSAPTVTALSQTSISLTVNAVENTTSTTYAIYNQTNSAYVNGSGESSVTPVWQMTSTWNTTPVTGLTCGTNYTFVTIGRNADLISTATSTGASAITSACSVVSSGSGGGGGGGGGGGYYIPIPVSAVTSTSSGNPAASSTSPVPSSTSTLPLPQEIATPIVPLDRPPVEAKPGMEAEVCPIDDVVILTACLHVSRDLKTEDRTLVHIKEDLVRMKIPATPFQAQRLANFMAYGDSWWTIRLGEGERRAVLVDALDTMIVKPPLTVKGDVTLKITAIDLDRITRGLIPHYRNLPAEQQRATRTLQTFLTLFNHSPNFSDVKDDLRWNVLIYRLRFVRDLPSERAGADLYRRMFRKNPSDSFQWSVVRVLGYVK